MNGGRRRPLEMVASVILVVLVVAGCGGEEAPARMGSGAPGAGAGAEGSGTTDTPGSGAAGSGIGGSAGTVAPATPAATIPVDAVIDDLIDGAGMTDLGRRLFLSASPSVENQDTLAQSCAAVHVGAGIEGSHTFGCLIDGTIHLRTFPPQVGDLIYVVAAHELLHVAYGQLTRSERLALGSELEAARAGNEVLEERLEVYASVDEDTPNEVHSLLGTEFADLSPTLEAHFAKYFDRTRVRAIFQRTLGDREDEIRELKASITRMEASLDAIQAELDAQDAAGDIEGYNANVARFNVLVAEHNAAVREVNRLVDEDNRLTG